MPISTSVVFVLLCVNLVSNVNCNERAKDLFTKTGYRSAAMTESEIPSAIKTYKEQSKKGQDTVFGLEKGIEKDERMKNLLEDVAILFCFKVDVKGTIKTAFLGVDREIKIEMDDTVTDKGINSPDDYQDWETEFSGPIQRAYELMMKELKKTNTDLNNYINRRVTFVFGGMVMEKPIQDGLTAGIECFHGMILVCGERTAELPVSWGNKLFADNTNNSFRGSNIEPLKPMPRVPAQLEAYLKKAAFTYVDRENWRQNPVLTTLMTNCVYFCHVKYKLDPLSAMSHFLEIFDVPAGTIFDIEFESNARFGMNSKEDERSADFYNRVQDWVPHMLEKILLSHKPGNKYGASLALFLGVVNQNSTLYGHGIVMVTREVPNGYWNQYVAPLTNTLNEGLTQLAPMAESLGTAVASTSSKLVSVGAQAYEKWFGNSKPAPS